MLSARYSHYYVAHGMAVQLKLQLDGKGSGYCCLYYRFLLQLADGLTRARDSRVIVLDIDCHCGIESAAIWRMPTDT